MSQLFLWTQPRRRRDALKSLTGYEANEREKRRFTPPTKRAMRAKGPMANCLHVPKKKYTKTGTVEL